MLFVLFDFSSVFSLTACACFPLIYHTQTLLVVFYLLDLSSDSTASLNVWDNNRYYASAVKTQHGLDIMASYGLVESLDYYYFVLWKVSLEFALVIILKVIAMLKEADVWIKGHFSAQKYVFYWRLFWIVSVGLWFSSECLLYFRFLSYNLSSLAYSFIYFLDIRMDPGAAVLRTFRLNSD